MAGWVINVKLFPHLAECQLRHRRLKRQLERTETLAALEVEHHLTWLTQTEETLAAHMLELPFILAEPVVAELGEDDAVTVRAMCRANFYLTALALKCDLVRAANTSLKNRQTHADCVQSRCSSRLIESIQARPPQQRSSPGARNGRGLQGGVRRPLADPG